MNERVEIQVRGIVQGVGFRPFVYGLAKDHSLAGCVRNNESGVLIEVEGERSSIDRFASALNSAAPPLAQIESIDCRELEVVGESDFRIVETSTNGERFVPVSPDVSVCADCLTELF